MAKACSRRPPSFELSKIVRQRAESVRRSPLFSHLPLKDCEKIVAIACLHSCLQYCEPKGAIGILKPIPTCTNGTQALPRRTLLTLLVALSGC